MSLTSYFNVPRSLVTMFVKHGAVIETNTWSETRVSGYSSGGGGYVGPGGGHVTPSSTTIRSTVTTENQLFLRHRDGSEGAYKVTGKTPSRAGHNVSIVYLGKASEDKGRPFYFRNHDIGEEGFDAAPLEAAIGVTGCFTMLVVTLGLAFAGMMVGVMLSRSEGVALTLAAAGFIAGCLLLRHRRARTHALYAELKEEAKQMAEAERAKGPIAPDAGPATA